MGRLSTHVLDTARGLPAAGVRIDLHRLDLDERVLVTAGATNADGRLVFESVSPGVYELTFHAGDYLRDAGFALTDPPFLDAIMIRFGVSAGNYHVPLLLSPYGYSTYRGS
jgi:5-hydroxyisourate hydrolase